MKKIIKNIFPPLIINLIKALKIRFEFFFSKNKNLVKKNILLKLKGKNKRAFLLATGPSIRLENLKLLNGEDCFSVSNFFLHEDIEDIKPKYHFFAPYHEPLILENYVEWLKQADVKLPKETKIFLSINTNELVEKYKLFPEREISYLFLADTYPKKIDLQKPVLCPQSGPLMILPVLFYMGYEEVYLLGCDHTVLRDYKKEISNFYNKNLDIRKNATDKNTWSDILINLESTEKMFYQYLYYAKCAEIRKSPKIFNLSQDTWLDYFPIKKLAEIK